VSDNTLIMKEARSTQLNRGISQKIVSLRCYVISKSYSQKGSSKWNGFEREWPL